MGKTKLVILGAGGAGVNTLGIIRQRNAKVNAEEQFNCIGFLDNDNSKWGREIHGLEVKGGVEEACKFPEDVQFVNTIEGATYFWEKRDIIAQAGVANSRFATVVHPDAYVAESAELKNGVVVWPDSYIYEDTVLGNHVNLKGVRLSHHNYIGDYSSIQGRSCIAGNVTIGESCYLGMNCTVKEDVTIGDGSLVAMGAVVVKDVEPGTVVGGVPAKYMRDVASLENKYSDL